MYQKITTTTRRFRKTAIIVIAAIFIAGAADAQNIAKTAKPLNLNEQYELKLADDSKSTSDFKIVVNEEGNLTISFETFADNAYATLFSKDGSSLKPIKSDVVSGNSYYTSLRWANRTYSYGLVLSWNTTTQQFKGNFTWELEAGTYYLRASRSTKGLSSAKLSIFLESKASIEKKLQEQKAEQERQLQAQKAKEERAAILALIGFGAFIILMIVIAIRSNKKANERRKEYQPIFDKIFKERGFSATEIIWTNCQYKIKEYEKVNNIVFGLKNSTLSFFGGGSTMVKFEIKDEKVAFYNIAAVPNWRKLIKENGDFLLSDGSVAKTLFPNNDNYKFRHLFDIPIHNIEDFEGTQKGKEVELLIEYSEDNFVKLSPVCGNVNPKIEIINEIIGALNKIMENNTLSKAKISTINDKISEAIKEDGRITTKRQLKILGAVVGTAVAIGGAAAASGARNWSKDR